MEEKTIRLVENNLDRVLKWVSIVDAKAKFTLSILLIVLGYSISQVSQLVELVEKVTKEEFWWIAIILIGMFFGIFISLICSFVFLVSIIYPKRDPTTGRDSIFFFESIAKMSAKEFCKKFSSMTEDQVIEELNDQTYNSAQVVKKKFDQLAKSITWFYISLFLLIVVSVAQQII
jgi:TRAP-type C4-dicarboxylate transport system permease large subunit